MRAKLSEAWVRFEGPRFTEPSMVEIEGLEGEREVLKP